MARHRADWSELYPELLISISGRLETRHDILHFRSVCKKWRSSIPKIPNNLPILSPLFPHKLPLNRPPFSLGPDLTDFNCSASSLLIVVNATFLLRPLNQNPNPNFNHGPKPWLITVEEFNAGKFILCNPLRRDKIEELPDYFPKDFDVSGCSVREIRRAYSFRYAEDTEELSWYPVSKVVMFFDPVCDSVTAGDDCFALLLHDRGSLLWLRLKHERKYGYLRYSRVSCFDDIVNYKGCVWAIDRKGRAYVIRYSNNLKLVQYSDNNICTGYVGDTRKRLVESSEGLYLIDRYHSEELIKFRVYKLNEEERKWNEVKSLDGRILVACTECCFFASTEDFRGYRGDCILFPKGLFPAYYGGTYPDEFYFKGASKELEIGVFHLEDDESGLVSTYPGYSDIFWPPPKWLFPDAFPSGWDGEEEEDSAIEMLCSGELCPSPMDLEANLQASDIPCTINGQEQFLGVDVPWSDIPSQLLVEIAKHLEAHTDLCRFRAVCKKWRASIPALPSSNLLSSLLPHKLKTTTAPFLDISSRLANHSVVLVASTVYLLQPCNLSLSPSKSWLVTVEELNAGKLFLRLPLRRVAIKDLPENFPRALNLSDFHVSEIGKEYTFRYADYSWGMFTTYSYASFPSSSNHKVVLFSESASTCPAIDNTTALVLYDKGDLVSFRLKDEDWLPVRYGPVTKFDDIVNFKGKIYAIDRKGRAYVISCNASTISKITDLAMGTGHGPDRQKRLVVSFGELYLIVRHSPEDKIYFRVYKLNEKLLKWDELESLSDKILFVTCSVCFVASARDFPGWKGNCIVFPADCLPTYSGSTYPDWRFFRRTIKELEIGVYHLDDNDGARLVKFYPGYSDIFWPPPAWLQQHACLSRNEDNSDFPCKHSQEEEVSPHSSELALEGQFVDNNSILSAQQDNTGAGIAASDQAPALNSPVQAIASGASTLNLEGLNIRPELLPILKKIWALYGNVCEGTVVRNPGMIATALENLAEAVLILKSTTGRSLDQSQTESLCATLSDLLYLQFRVDWLAPFVQRALACQTNKQLGKKLRQIESKKAEILNIREQVLELEQIVAKALRELNEEAGSVNEEVDSLGPIDLDKCLGEGLC